MAKKNIRFKNGDVFKVSLAPYLEFSSYVIYVNLSTILEKPTYSDLIIVKDYFSADQAFDQEELERARYFLTPFVVAGLRDLLAFSERVANVEIGDIEIPHVKRSWPLFVAPEKAEKWEVFKNAGNDKSDFVMIKNFAAVQHLNEEGALNASKIPFRIAYEYFKRKGKDLAAEFELDWLDKAIVKNITSIPSFDSIPNGIIGKPDASKSVEPEK